MDIILLLAGIACLIVGLLGAVLPLPGPPLSFVGILCLHFSRYAEFSEEILWGLGLATVAVAVLDYYVPIWGTKKFGGSRYGVWGSMLGLIIGLFFFPPFGLFIGSFLGAFIGELVAGTPSSLALKAAFGSFLGFLAGIFIKIVLCLVMLYYGGSTVWHYFQQ